MYITVFTTSGCWLGRGGAITQYIYAYRVITSMYVCIVRMCSIVEVLMAIRCTVCGPGGTLPWRKLLFQGLYKEVSAAILDCLTTLIPENG